MPSKNDRRPLGKRDQARVFRTASIFAGRSIELRQQLGDVRIERRLNDQWVRRVERLLDLGLNEPVGSAGLWLSIIAHDANDLTSARLSIANPLTPS